jgi:hypothetical protein
VRPARLGLCCTLAACNELYGLEPTEPLDAYVPTGPIQHVVAATPGSMGPLTISISPTSAGHALVAVAVVATYGVHIDNMTDDAGNVWTRALDGVDGTGARAEIWYVLGARSITQATATVSRGVAIDLMEWDGLAPPGSAVASHSEPEIASATMVTTGVLATISHALVIGIAACVGPSPATLSNSDFIASSFLITNTDPPGGGNVAYAPRVAGTQQISWSVPSSPSCTSGIIAIPISQ